MVRACVKGEQLDAVGDGIEPAREEYMLSKRFVDDELCLEFVDPAAYAQAYIGVPSAESRVR